MKISSVELVFENCECYTISKDHIKFFEIYCPADSNPQINRATISIAGFSMILDSRVPCQTHANTYKNAMQRLIGRDVTSIEVSYTDGKFRRMYLDWPDGNWFQHPDQYCTFAPNGDILYEHSPYGCSVIEPEYLDDVSPYIGSVFLQSLKG